MIDTTNSEEDIKYLSDQYKSERDEPDYYAPPSGPSALEKQDRMRLSKMYPMISSAPNILSNQYEKGYYEDEIDGFTGDSYELLQKYKRDKQSGGERAFNTIVGGAMSGIGTFIESVGYLADLNTYRAMFTDIDFDGQLKSFTDFHPNSLLARGLQEIGKGIKSASDEWMPIYEREAQSLTDQIFSWSTAKGIIDSVVGFTLTGFGAGQAVKYGLKGLTKVAGAGGEVLETALAAKNLAKASKLTQWTAKQAHKLARIEGWTEYMMQRGAPKTMQFLQAQAAGIMSKGAEARIEGLSAYEASMELLEPLVRSGQKTLAEAKEIANEQGNHAFMMTMATSAFDAYMLKGLFQPAHIAGEKVMKAGLKKTAIKFGKEMIGAPKEATEEMWQEAAQMEGQYETYNQVKAILNEDQDLKMQKQIGYNPKTMSSNFLERTIAFLGSERSQVAGWVGGITGPLQSMGIDAVTGRKLRKQEKEAFERQQAIIKSNETLFGPAYGLATRIKDLVQREDLKAQAAVIGDKIVEDYASELLFATEAIDNFEAGTIDELEKILEDNKSPENAKHKKTLENLKQIYLKSRPYGNSDDVFKKMFEIDYQKRLIGHYKTKAVDPTISEDERKDYAEGAKKGEETLKQWEAQLKDMTSMDKQTYLFSQQRQYEELKNIIKDIDTYDSITELQKLYKKYKSPVIKQRIDTLQKIDKDKIAEEEKQKTPTGDDPSKDKDDALGEPELKPNQKVTYRGKEFTIKENGITRNAKGKIIKIVFNEPNSKGTGNASAGGGKGFTNAQLHSMVGNQVQAFKVEPLTPDAATALLDHVFKSMNKAGVEIDGKVEQLNLAPEKDGSDQAKIIQIYNESATQATSEEEFRKIFQKRVENEIYLSKLSGKTDTEQVEELEQEVDETFAAFKESFGDVTDPINEIDPEDTVRLDYNEGKSEMSKRAARFAMLSRLIELAPEVYGEIESFSDLIDYLMVRGGFSIEHLRLDSVYEEIRDLYAAISGQDKALLAENVDTLLNLEDKEYHSLEGNDYEQNKAALESEGFVVDEESDFVSLLNVYNESVVSRDKKNKYPAVSFGYRSRKWNWRVFGKGKQATEVTREDADEEVDPNNILNPNKFNAGDKISFKLKPDFKGKITLSSGKRVLWSEMLKAGKQGGKAWEVFRKRYGLKSNETYYDYYPITISSAEDEDIAAVHTVAWINHLNSAGTDEIIESNKQINRNFRKKVIPYLEANPTKTVDTVVEEKVLGTTKTNGPLGFVLSLTQIARPAVQNIPDPNLKFGVTIRGSMRVAGNKAIEENILNKNTYNRMMQSNVVYVLVPVGKKNGKMQYWAHGVQNGKLKEHTGVTKALRQAVEIFVKQDPTINQELYDAYKSGPEGLDLLDSKDLTTVLKKVLYVYAPSKSNKYKSLEEEIKGAPAGKTRAMINSHNGIITFASTTVKVNGVPVIHTISKGKVTKQLDAMLNLLEEQIFSNMLFNLQADHLNSDKPFHFVKLDAAGKVLVNTKPYNETLKEFCTTKTRGIKLNDGNYAYTLQNIVKFDLDTALKNVPEEAPKDETNLQKTSLTREQKIEKVNKAVQELIQNSSFIKLDSSNTFYIDERVTAEKKEEISHLEIGNMVLGANGGIYKITAVKDGIPSEAKDEFGKVVPIAQVYTRKYKRVSENIGKEASEKGATQTAALNFGNQVDELVRHFFSGKLKDLKEYKFADEATIQEFVDQLTEFKKVLDDKGEVVLAENIVVFNERLGIAGTLDLLTYDKNGDLHIYDMKTMNGNHFAEVYNKETEITNDSLKQGEGSNKVNKFNSSIYGLSKFETYSRQLSLYNILMAATHGVSASGISIIPIELNYSKDGKKTEVLRIITPEDNPTDFSVALPILNEVQGMKLKETKVEIVDGIENIELSPEDNQLSENEELRSYAMALDDNNDVDAKMEELIQTWKNAKNQLPFEKYLEHLKRKVNNKKFGC